MIIAASLRRKALVTAVAAVSFVSLYEVTMLDSHAPWGPGAVIDAAGPGAGRAPGLYGHGVL